MNAYVVRNVDIYVTLIMEDTTALSVYPKRSKTDIISYRCK